MKMTWIARWRPCGRWRITVSTTLILGGGPQRKKAPFAEEMPLESNKSVLYTATATAGDEEMTARIAAHRLHGACLANAGSARAGLAIHSQELRRRSGDHCGLHHAAGEQPAAGAAGSRSMKKPTRLRWRRGRGSGSLHETDPGEEWWIVSKRWWGSGWSRNIPWGGCTGRVGTDEPAAGAVCGHVIFMAAGLPLRIKLTKRPLRTRMQPNLLLRGGLTKDSSV